MLFTNPHIRNTNNTACRLAILKTATRQQNAKLQQVINLSFKLGLSVYILSLLSSKSSPNTSGDGCCLSWTNFVSEEKSDSDHLLLEPAGQSPESPKHKFMLQICTTNKFPSSKDLQWQSQGINNVCT
jgi:hypothetical protein